jgi:hypothetical protein
VNKAKRRWCNCNQCDALKTWTHPSGRKHDLNLCCGHLIILWLFHLGISCAVFVVICTVVVLYCFVMCVCVCVCVRVLVICILYSDWGFSYPDWGFSYPDWGFS